MTRWSGSRRISPRAIRWSTGRAISAISMATAPPPIATPKRGMTDVARLLLEGIDEDAVDFRDNYSGDQQEPMVLPAALPNLLANGAQGIAVGMATSIPPHNLAELCDAALYLIAHPNASTDQLLKFAPGPDFPTGGVLVEPRESIAETYRTGRGSFRLRARWAKEEGARGVWVVVVTEIPYMVQKSRLIEKIAELLNDKKLPLVADIRDEFGRGRPRRHRAEEPRGRSGHADGAALQADRARDPLPDEHERAGRRRRAARRLVRGGAAAMARPSPRGARCAARATGSPRSSAGSKCWPACSSSSSISTR